MQCFNDFKGDRICELCERANRYEFDKCKNKYDEKAELRHKLCEIELKCPYKTDCWDECTPFVGCDKNGNGHGRFADDCIVTLECGNY